MTTPIAVQLYSVRDALQADFEGTLRRLATMGYTGVEFAGVYGESPQAAAALCAELGLQVTSLHTVFNEGVLDERLIEIAQTLGTNTIVCAWMSPERFLTQAGITQAANELNTAAATLKAHGLRLAYHNHEFEFMANAETGIPHEMLRQQLSPDVLFEIDSYWVHVAGSVPSQVLRDLAGRVPLIHLKDGTGKRDGEMLALGSGVMDIADVVAAGADAEWFIVELDTFNGDMMTAIAASFAYLVEQGITHGR